MILQSCSYRCRRNFTREVGNLSREQKGRFYGRLARQVLLVIDHYGEGNRWSHRPATRGTNKIYEHSAEYAGRLSTVNIVHSG